ncbi:sigma factor-like helix-turn-helix DNA-binding protein [Streptomyces sp. NPDC053431]|uniref:sigma factor-like helix-turn-helix DNA-binding protein n=1 Tax=Streptomyces sp. NPDC053431 TaxID=3365703 RepID=UPI0037D40449
MSPTSPSVSLPSPKERRRLREALSLSEDQVAEALGVTRATVRSWETGRSAPRGRKREAYAKLLGVYEEPTPPQPEKATRPAPDPTRPRPATKGPDRPPRTPSAPLTTTPHPAESARPAPQEPPRQPEERLKTTGSDPRTPAPPAPPATTTGAAAAQVRTRGTTAERGSAGRGSAERGAEGRGLARRGTARRGTEERDSAEGAVVTNTDGPARRAAAARDDAARGAAPAGGHGPTRRATAARDDAVRDGAALGSAPADAHGPNRRATAVRDGAARDAVAADAHRPARRVTAAADARGPVRRVIASTGTTGPDAGASAADRAMAGVTVAAADAGEAAGIAPAAAGNGSASAGAAGAEAADAAVGGPATEATPGTRTTSTSGTQAAAPARATGAGAGGGGSAGAGGARSVAADARDAVVGDGAVRGARGGRGRRPRREAAASGADGRIDAAPAAPEGGEAAGGAEVGGVGGLTPEEAFDALYAYAAPSLAHQTYLLTGRRRLSRESVERAFHHAWQHWPEVAVDRDPVGWVRAAAYEYALSPWHRFRRRHRHPDSPPTDGSRRALLTALLELPPPYRRTVLLYDGLGLDLPETAAETEASTPAAGNRLLHAREFIARQLPELADPEALHSRLSTLVAEAPTATLPAARSVRSGSERRARLLTRAVFGATAVLIGLTAFTVVTAPTRYIPLIAPGEVVEGVPVRGGPPKLRPEDKELREMLRTAPNPGPERLVPSTE